MCWRKFQTIAVMYCGIQGGEHKRESQDVADGCGGGGWYPETGPRDKVGEVQWSKGVSSKEAQGEAGDGGCRWTVPDDDKVSM